MKEREESKSEVFRRAENWDRHFLKEIWWWIEHIWAGRSELWFLNMGKLIVY